MLGNNKVRKQSKLSNVEKTSLKYYISYMASINHPLSVGAVKALAWVIIKKSDLPKQI